MLSEYGFVRLVLVNDFPEVARQRKKIGKRINKSRLETELSYVLTYSVHPVNILNSIILFLCTVAGLSSFVCDFMVEY